MFLALLPPSCYPFPKNLNLLSLAAEPKMMDFTICMWTSEYNLSQAHTEVLWPGFPLHWLVGLSVPWEKFKLLHLGCVERSIMSLSMSLSPGQPCASAWHRCLGNAGEHWARNKANGKVSTIIRQDNIPICFLQKVHGFFITIRFASRTELFIAAWSQLQRLWQITEVQQGHVHCTCHKKGFPKYTVNSLVHHGAAKVCTF